MGFFSFAFLCCFLLAVLLAFAAACLLTGGFPTQLFLATNSAAATSAAATAAAAATLGSMVRGTRARKRPGRLSRHQRRQHYLKKKCIRH